LINLFDSPAALAVLLFAVKKPRDWCKKLPTKRHDPDFPAALKSI
jgi:hypothetical protein